MRLIQSRIVADGVSGDAVANGEEVVGLMLRDADPEVLKNLIDAGVHIYIIPKDKKLVDLPPFAYLKGERTFDGRRWDEVRGIGDTPLPNGSAIAVGEENLVLTTGLDSKGYPALHTLVHEFGHAVQLHGLPKEPPESIEQPGPLSRTVSAARAFRAGLGSHPLTRPDWITAWTGAKIAYAEQREPCSLPRSKELYREAMATETKTGLGWYADANDMEYFAESTGAYFSTGYTSDTGADTSPALLHEKHPKMAKFLYAVYGPPKAAGK
ncbi:MAG: hypothetical protein ABII00_10475 [Elusimicrobiota bacterium]